METALGDLRVVELAGRMTAYGGKLLADLGADVILVEPPAGSPLRQQEPFATGPGGRERSLAFTYLNTNKRGVTLDLESGEGLRQLSELVETADVLLEDCEPGWLVSKGLGYETLAKVKPDLVQVSITNFGQDGPYARFLASDLTLLAMGGLLYLGGYADGQPVRAAGDQALLAAGQFAAVSALIALLQAKQTGRGQLVDVSAQECVVAALETSAQYWDLEHTVRGRTRSGQQEPGSGVLPCKDGHIYMTARFGPNNAYWPRLVDWLVEDGAANAEQLRDARWTDPAFIRSAEARQQFAGIFLPFAMARTRSELYEAASRRELPFSPINDPRDVLNAEQLQAREYFVPALDLAGPDGKAALMAGPPYKLSATPWQLRRPAPKLGEHNQEVLSSLRGAQGVASSGAKPGPTASGSGHSRPLEGIRVADFTWHGAGSFTTRMLADHGAEVIKFESSARIDSLRLMPPFKDKQQNGSPNRSGYFSERNANKRSMTLNLKHPKAREVAVRLIQQSDIVSNNFAPGTMERFGLGYDEVRKIKPDIIYLAMSMQGATGPDRLNSGYGLTISALSGLHYLSGLPDREPVGTGTNYSDHIPAPCHAAVAVLAALHHRRRTGEGQYIELSQAETMISCLGVPMLEYTVNGVIPQRQGNLMPGYGPSGVYPCQGEDRWIAISTATESQWRALCGVLDAAALATDARFATLADRRRNHAELDGVIAQRTREREAYELLNQLQAQGVPAGVVQTAADVMDRDPQLKERRHWVTLEHAEMGPCRYGEPPFHLSANPEPRLLSPAPLLGQHTGEVCVSLLGYSEADVSRMIEDGVLA